MILNKIIVRIYGGPLEQRSTMKIRLSMHPRNFASEKIVRTYLRTSTRSCKRMLSVLPYIHDQLTAVNCHRIPADQCHMTVLRAQVYNCEETCFFIVFRRRVKVFK